MTRGRETDHDPGASLLLSLCSSGRRRRLVLIRVAFLKDMVCGGGSTVGIRYFLLLLAASAAVGIIDTHVGPEWK